MDRKFRNALGKFTTGVAVVTSEVEGVRLGATINSFSSVSLEPPLVLFSIARTALAFGEWCRTPRFAITVLGAGDDDLSNRFAMARLDKWDGVNIEEGDNGMPLLTRGIAWFECDTYTTYDGGDHTIILGQVSGYRTAEGAPLAFFSGKYCRLHAGSAIVTPPDADLWLHGW